MIKKQRGRPEGSVSTVRVKMKDLMKYIASEGTVVVGSAWLREIGLGINETPIVKIKLVNPTPENTIVETKDLV